METRVQAVRQVSARIMRLFLHSLLCLIDDPSRFRHAKATSPRERLSKKLRAFRRAHMTPRRAKILRRFDQRADDRPSTATAVATCEQMIFSAKRDGTDPAFDGIGVEFNTAVTEEAR